MAREGEMVKMGPSGLAILMIGVSIVAGCAVNPAPVRSLAFYDETGDPSEKAPGLLQAEIKGITDTVAASTDDSIWFIRVKPSFPDGPRGDIIVYLTPQQRTPRIRTGLAYSLRMIGERTSIVRSWKYVQVSEPNDVFTELLVLPSVVDMPFEWFDAAITGYTDATAISEEEIPRIVDFVRQPFNYDHLPEQGRPSKHIVVCQIRRLPILSLYRSGEKIQVKFGFIHTGTWGRGIMVTMAYTRDGYVVTGWGIWYLGKGRYDEQIVKL
jgi:hypothetical protein